MKILVLVRHASAEQEIPGSPDGDLGRKLTSVGLEQAKATAKLLSDFWRDQSLMPPSIVSSSAIRARQTADPIADEFLIPSIRFKDSLYTHPKEHWLKIIRASDASSNSLVLVSHNPVISELASTYLNTAVHFEPSDFLIVQFDGNWSDVETNPWRLMKASSKIM